MLLFANCFFQLFVNNYHVILWKISDFFLSVFIAATATHSVIVKEELRIHCQQMERQNNKRRKHMINRLWYDTDIFRIIPHINPRLHISPWAFGPQTDMGVLGWYGVWYEKCHKIISINYFMSDLYHLPSFISFSAYEAWKWRKTAGGYRVTDEALLAETT